MSILSALLDNLANSVIRAFFALTHALSEAVLPSFVGLEHVFIGPGDLGARFAAGSHALAVVLARVAMEVGELVVPGDGAALLGGRRVRGLFNGGSNGFSNIGEGRVAVRGGVALSRRIVRVAMRVLDGSRVVVAGLPALRLRQRALTQDY